MLPYTNTIYITSVKECRDSPLHICFFCDCAGILMHVSLEWLHSGHDELTSSHFHTGILSISLLNTFNARMAMATEQLAVPLEVTADKHDHPLPVTNADIDHDHDHDNNNDNDNDNEHEDTRLEKNIRLKIDIRLCSIAGLLCCLNLLDSGILSSASVTSMLHDLNLQGSRYSASIYTFTIASVVFKLPCTICVRLVGPRIWFALATFCFGIITLCTAFIHTWGQMIALRVLLGIAMSGVYPGMTYLISVWYTRREQQLRFALMQSGEVIGLATGNIVNYALNHLDGRAGLAGWRWMFLVQGLISCVVGILTYWWMIDFPEQAHRSFRFLSEEEAQVASRRIQKDRDDVIPEAFSWQKVLVCFADPKLYGFSCMFFLLNLVSTSLNYFLPIILKSGMGFSGNASIILSTPVRPSF